ncbi:hypothetical protein [Paracidobacterium acidisoli]|uniref:DUF4352 domain-containing protein n=1 Tax=Paracidobacterium acidisoli TaxID=2303751 RepID=A0A372IUX5_9BACT|nr:hypothetical protein [Paracidobacterium acidisoli]MBT9330072.1 hypothetical protein [Paracidobacterium acidisoli]
MSDDSSPANHPIVVVLAAMVIAVLAIGAYVWINNKPPVHAGQVLSITAYPIHRDLSTGSGIGGLNGEKDTFDEVIVLADVRIRNQADIPIFLHDMSGDVTMADDSVQHGTAAGRSDFQKVFIAYSDLAPQKKEPILRDMTLTPGQQVEGQMIFHYPITKDQWNQRKNFAISVEFQHQKNLVMQAPAGTVFGS